MSGQSPASLLSGGPAVHSLVFWDPQIPGKAPVPVTSCNARSAAIDSKDQLTILECSGDKPAVQATQKGHGSLVCTVVCWHRARTWLSGCKGSTDTSELSSSRSSLHTLPKAIRETAHILEGYRAPDARGQSSLRSNMVHQSGRMETPLMVAVYPSCYFQASSPGTTGTHQGVEESRGPQRGQKL